MLTLVEVAKLTDDPVKSGVVEMFARESDILRVLPFDTVGGSAYAYNQEGQLPAVAFRGFNESYAESSGVLNPLTEALKIVGGDLDVDRALVQMHGEGVRSQHEAMKIKAIAHSWTTAFIKGNSQTNPREFDGLQVRVIGGQLVSNSAATGAALSLLTLDDAIDRVDSPTHLLMSKAMRRRFTAAARTSGVSGNIEYEVDEFGRQVTMYAGLPILVPYSQNGGTEPLAFDEAAEGGGSASTSIYVLSIGPGMLKGIQNSEISVRDLGELQAGVAFRTRVDWLMAFAIEHGRAVARVYGITNAAIVA